MVNMLMPVIKDIILCYANYLTYCSCCSKYRLIARNVEEAGYMNCFLG